MKKNMFNYDVEFFVNWLAVNHYLGEFFNVFSNKFGKNAFLTLLKKRSNGYRPCDYIEGILEYEVGSNKDMDKINNEWKNYIKDFVDYKPQHYDFVYTGFCDVYGLHTWITIFDRFGEHGVVEIASAYYEAPLEYQDEIGNITYGVETNSYSFMRKATDTEKEWLLDLLKSDGFKL